MAFMEIKCGKCGNKLFIHDYDNWNDPTARTCPTCHKRIEDQTWNNIIVQAFTWVHESEMALEKDTTNYGYPRFDVAFHNGHTWITAHMNNGRQKSMTLAAAQEAIDDPRRNGKIIAFSCFDDELEKKLNRELDKKAEQHKRAINKSMGIDDSHI